MLKTTLATCAFGVLGLILAGCGSSDDGQTGDDQNVTAGCRSNSATPCTPEVGSPLRKGIADLLRFSISRDLAKNGVEPKDSDVKFVFKTMLIQNEHIYVAATIMKGDGTTPFDMAGTPFAGKPNNVQSLLEVESGSEFTHRIGIGLDPKRFACAFVESHFDGQAPQIYPGNMNADCAANPLPAAAPIGDGDGDGDGGGDGDGDGDGDLAPKR